MVEYIRQSNVKLIDLAKDPRTTPKEFLDVSKKIKNETGYDIWNKFSQVRGRKDTVKL